MNSNIGGKGKVKGMPVTNNNPYNESVKVLKH